MEVLKFKNALYAVIYVGCFATVCTIFTCIFGIVFTYFFENARDFRNVIFYGSLVVLAVWIISGLVILLNKTVIVTSTEIKMCRGKKVKWIIKKEDLQECIYNEMKWYGFLFPISSVNAFSLQFKVNGRKNLLKEHCSLSLRQVRTIQKEFAYPIRQIHTIYEQ